MKNINQSTTATYTSFYCYEMKCKKREKLPCSLAKIKSHLKFLKQILGIKPQTSNVTVYDELCRIPLSIIHKEIFLKYWYKLMKSLDSLIYKALLNLKEDMNWVIGWALEGNNLLNDLGFSYLWNNEDITLLQLNKAIERLHDQCLQYFYSEFSTELITYNKSKGSLLKKNIKTV